MEDTLLRLTATVEDRHWWFQERRAIIDRHVRRLGRTGRALDVGGAGGGNARVLRRRGWDVKVADYSPEAVEIARERGLDAIHADARDLPFPDAGFDLIVAFDVLEHIKEDDQAARELARVLRPGGTALIAVPCDMRLWSEHDVISGHFRRYTKPELKALIAGSGLVVDRMWSWNVLLRPAAAWHRRKHQGNAVGEVPPVLNACLRTVIAMERYLPVGALPGVSIMLRAHRP
ncbi:methyltransferase [Sphaerisporangium melleum]|uniref:Methyltransferase n=1 Tax=Sphaerisporangium melleum TaxID=321316 RepID=A0A917QT95_9ACTN|nr:class I SAM-dependent methyltransferase [Sphaerisporangium melleum]GGK67413.1 methyltransferase [Sphaerisporangium melleum]GII68479.1 methyltransferase [Sphaerisporangium melleum]